MFDNYNIRQAPNYPQEIHHHRAPTDESIRLLREMEAAAQAKLEASGKIENNIVTGRWYVYNDHVHDEQTLVLRMKINDCEVRLDAKITRDLYYDRQGFFRRLALLIAQAIADPIYAEFDKVIHELR